MYVYMSLCLMYISHTHHEHYIGMSVRDFTTLGAMLFLLRRTDLNPGSGSKVLRRTKISTRVKARGLVSDVTPPHATPM